MIPASHFFQVSLFTASQDLMSLTTPTGQLRQYGMAAVKSGVDQTAPLGLAMSGAVTHPQGWDFQQNLGTPLPPCWHPKGFTATKSWLFCVWSPPVPLLSMQEERERQWRKSCPPANTSRCQTLQTRTCSKMSIKVPKVMNTTLHYDFKVWHHPSDSDEDAYSNWSTINCQCCYWQWAAPGSQYQIHQRQNILKAFKVQLLSSINNILSQSQMSSITCLRGKLFVTRTNQKSG